MLNTQDDFPDMFASANPSTFGPQQPPMPFDPAQTMQTPAPRISIAKEAVWADEKPLPLRSPHQEQTAYPVKALGGFADAVEAFAHGVKVPLAMASASVLSALSCGAQGIANVLTKDGRVIPLSLFVLTIADSGDRKSALDRAVLHGIYGIEKQNYIQYQGERQRFETAQTAWEKLPKKEREANPFTMQEPHSPAMIMENANAEGAFRQLKEGRPSVVFSSDEGGTFFGGQAFQKEYVLKTITFFSNLWDGKAIDKVRAGEGATRLYDRRASMHMQLQPVIAQNILSDGMMQDQGFLPRFLISFPQSLKGTRFYDGENVRNNTHVVQFYQACEALLQTPLRIDEGTGGLILDNICLSEDAHILWVDHHDHVEKMLNPDGELNLVSAYASKNAEQALRIAGVLTLAENQGARIISAPTMANAITLAQWYLTEALRLREEGTTSPDILKAEKLLKWIEKREEKFISSRLVMRNGPNGLRTRKEAESTIKTLEEHGHLRKGQGSVDIRGVATQTFWEVVA